MNTKLMEAIGFAYIVVGDYKWHFFVDMDGNVQREKVGMMIR